MRIHTIIFLAALLSFAPACGDDGATVVDTNGTGDHVGPPVTRSEIILTADEYARLHWTMSATNQTGVSCGGGFSSDYPTGTRIGMGYKWGGWTDIENFLLKIDEGFGTGTGGGANTYDNYSIDCVVGVSCTGLVSRAWHLKEKYTLCYADPDIPRKLCDISEDIVDIDFGNHDAGDLKKGDAFINVYHTILFVYETRDGNLCIIDSSIEGVRFREVSWEYLNDSGYKAIRYHNIEKDPDPPGTTVNPIPIDSDAFPFVHDGNTRDVVSMVIDRYSVDPGSIQTGPEVIYELRLKNAGAVTIIVSDIKDEGINNDIHLLGSLDVLDEVLLATNCLEKADNRMTKELLAGVYYIAIDSSSDTPGEFTLFVDFE